MAYNKLFLEHFQNPRNIGSLDNYNADFEAENESDSDKIRFFLRIEEGRVKEVSYLVKGCPRIIASCSYISEKVRGLSLEEIDKLDKNTLRLDLGFDENDFLCIDLPRYAISQAIEKYRKNS